MSFHEKIIDIEGRAKARGIRMKQIYTAAGINKSTLYRWKTGDMEPLFSTWSRFVSTADEILKDEAAE